MFSPTTPPTAAPSGRARDREFWLAQFEQRPEPTALAPGIPISAHTYRRAAADLGLEAADALQAVAARTNIPWPDILVAIAAAYTARHVGRSDVCMGVATMNRFGTPAARVPAMVMNILPVRIATDEDQPLDEWLLAVSKTLQRARRHGNYRSEQLRRDLGLLGGERRLYGPLVNVLPFDAPPVLVGAAAEWHVLGTGPVDDLTITWRGDATGSGLRLELDANPALYTDDTRRGARRAALGVYPRRPVRSISGECQHDHPSRIRAVGRVGQRHGAYRPGDDADRSDRGGVHTFARGHRPDWQRSCPELRRG